MKNNLRLLNSSTKELVAIDQKEISIYLCGPTVYNHVHIGNIRPIITYDVVHRLLLSQNIKVKFIHNITDIDDKIINFSIKEKVSEKELSTKYFNFYKEILNKLNILPIEMPKVSDNMDDIITYIGKIVDLKSAYFVDNDIYFSINNNKEYGTVSNMDIDKLDIGSRISNNIKKESPNDFILWKNTKIGITWDSPFGKGRPGWHTECSVLINKFIGDQVYIHAGGIDLRFPHHENENIQNVIINKKPLAKIWNHTGHLMIDNQKMSKSLNNFILAKDLIEKSNPNSVRWMFYQTKYEKPFNYVEDMILESQKSIDKIERELNKACSYLILNNSLNIIKEINDEVYEILNDNLDLPNLVTYIYDQIKTFAKNISLKNFEELNKVYFNVKNTLSLIGIIFLDIHSKENIELLKKWNDLLSNKKYDEADKIRSKLIEKKLI